MINVTVEGLLPLKRQLQLLMMPTGTRRRLLYRVAQRVMRDSRKRVRSQTDLQGRPFASPRHKPRLKPRKYGGGKGILGGMVGGSMAFRVLTNNSVFAKIGWHGVQSEIGGAQQYGGTEVETREGNIAKLKKAASKKNDPATKRQAKALRDLGFRPRSGKHRTSNKDIMANMTVGQAGAIIRTLRTKQGKPPKQSWVTRLPARSFLGATASEVNDYINLIFDQITQGIRRGIR